MDREDRRVRRPTCMPLTSRPRRFDRGPTPGSHRSDSSRYRPARRNPRSGRPPSMPWSQHHLRIVPSSCTATTCPSTCCGRAARSPDSPTGTASTEGLAPSMSGNVGGTWPRSTHPIGQRNSAHVYESIVGVPLHPWWDLYALLHHGDNAPDVDLAPGCWPRAHRRVGHDSSRRDRCRTSTAAPRLNNRRRQPTTFDRAVSRNLAFLRRARRWPDQTAPELSPLDGEVRRRFEATLTDFFITVAGPLKSWSCTSRTVVHSSAPW